MKKLNILLILLNILPMTLVCMETKPDKKTVKFAAIALVNGEKIPVENKSLFKFVDDKSLEDLAEANPNLNNKVGIFRIKRDSKAKKDLVTYVDSEDSHEQPKITDPFDASDTELAEKVANFKKNNSDATKRVLAFIEKHQK